jgi:hypothetical protein
MRVLFPSLEPETPGVRVFRAPWPWVFNVCGAVVAGIGTAVAFLVYAGILVWSAHRFELLPVIFILSVVAGVTALFPGNFVAAFPYGIGIEEGKGIRLYAPFTEMYVPFDEVKEVKWSYLRPGWLIRLKRRRGLLTSFTIHVAWGRQGRELAQAIGEELARVRPAER